MTAGKRAAVASGVLGMLCVLAELCFLLPDLLVTRDALPFYQANLPLFRGILLACILATFALGAAGVLLLRSKVHGLLGIALGSVALLMGGAQAEPLGVDGHRAFAAGLDYFVLELLCSACSSSRSSGCTRCASSASSAPGGRPTSSTSS
jgi:hypothetical protein